MISRKLCIGALATAAALAISAPGAFAQDGWVRGDGAGTAAAASQRALGNLNCGAVTLRVLRSDNVGASFDGTGFATIPNALRSVNVGGSRCIKVTFDAESTCGLSGALDACYVRATINGSAMSPNDNSRALDSENPTGQGHSLTWFAGVGSGTHTIRIQGRVGNSSTTFFVDDWTMDVEVSERLATTAAAAAAGKDRVVD